MVNVYVQLQDTNTVAYCHWSAERVITEEEEDVRKQEVIMAGCNLIPIMYDESPMCTQEEGDYRHAWRSPLICDSWETLSDTWTEERKERGRRGEVTRGGRVHSERRYTEWSSDRRKECERIKFVKLRTGQRKEYMYLQNSVSLFPSLEFHVTKTYSRKSDETAMIAWGVLPTEMLMSYFTISQPRVCGPLIGHYMSGIVSCTEVHLFHQSHIKMED